MEIFYNYLHSFFGQLQQWMFILYSLFFSIKIFSYSNNKTTPINASTIPGGLVIFKAQQYLTWSTVTINWSLISTKHHVLYIKWATPHSIYEKRLSSGNFLYWLLFQILINWFSIFSSHILIKTCTESNCFHISSQRWWSQYSIMHLAHPFKWYIQQFGFHTLGIINKYLNK